MVSRPWYLREDTYWPQSRYPFGDLPRIISGCLERRDGRKSDGYTGGAAPPPEITEVRAFATPTGAGIGKPFLYFCEGHVDPEAFLAAIGTTGLEPSPQPSDVAHGHLAENRPDDPERPSCYGFHPRVSVGTPVTVVESPPYRPLWKVPPWEADRRLGPNARVRNHRLLVGEDPETVFRLVRELTRGSLEELESRHGHAPGGDPSPAFAASLNRVHRLQRKRHSPALTVRQAFVLLERLGFRGAARSVRELSATLGLYKGRVIEDERVAAGRVRDRLEFPDEPPRSWDAAVRGGAALPVEVKTRES